MSVNYLKLSRKALKEKIRQAWAIIKKCTLCPRNCMVDRTAGETGFCSTGDKPFVSSFNPHFGEEAPLVGHNGSGTIFFTNCNLGCLFCQNWTISHSGEGGEISFESLADIMLTLQGYGCHNINFVTPTHQVYQILASLEIAIEKGLKAPLVYNCGGYESVETLRILDGVIDIYMPDFKYADPEAAKKYSRAKDYPSIAKAAIKEMHRQVGDLVLDDRGIAIKGLLVRHLVLPEGLAGTEEVTKFLAEEISPDTYVNIMAQYYPCYRAFEQPPLNRRITDAEYRKAVKAARDAGLKRLDRG
ncbi:MAG: radical SAM protein [Nitrospiraceae bacterium]|nr:MAG: radical SAM protein [Nitrospiraceae bacterium]